MRIKLDKPTMVVGDIHGMYHIVTRVLKEAIDKDYNVVFVGDYLDSRTLGTEEQMKALDVVIKYAQSLPDRVTAILGNHEWSYIDLRKMCSGWRGRTYDAILNGGYVELMSEVMKPYVFVGDWLITHAGVSGKLLKEYNLTLDTYLKDEYYHHMIGRSRGGNCKYGAHYWCDFFNDFEPIDGLNQVFGHTNCGSSPVVVEGNNSININVDCINDEGYSEIVLLMPDGAISKFDIIEIEGVYNE